MGEEKAERLRGNTLRADSARAEWSEVSKLAGYDSPFYMLYDLYHNQLLSAAKVAKKLGFTKSTIFRHMKESGIPSRPPGGDNRKKG